MFIEEGLQAFLSTNEAVQALLGTRIYPVWLPQKASLPAATYSRIETEIHNTLDGNAQGINSGLFEIVVWDKDYMSAKRAARAIREELLILDAPMGGVLFLGITWEDEGDANHEQALIIGAYGVREQFRITADDT